MGAGLREEEEGEEEEETVAAAGEQEVPCVERKVIIITLPTQEG